MFAQVNLTLPYSCGELAVKGSQGGRQGIGNMF